MDDKDSQEFNDKLEWAMADCQGDSAFSLDRNRPYNGQSHTDQGERGKTLVSGLTMRDVSDCFVKGLLDAGGLHDIKNPIHDDIYKVDLNKIDPGAVIQNAVCHVEKMMGIYPNVPELRSKNE